MLNVKMNSLDNISIKLSEETPNCRLGKFYKCNVIITCNFMITLLTIADLGSHSNLDNLRTLENHTDWHIGVSSLNVILILSNTLILTLV